MQKTAPRLAISENALSVSDLERYAQGWLLDGEIRQHSRRTQDTRRDLVTKLLWFLKQRECASCGLPELRQFLAYITTGHETKGGRWGNPQMTRPVRPRTVHTYHGNLRTLFHFLVTEGAIASSPMETLRPPVARTDQVQPFTSAQIAALLAAAKRSHYPRRDEAILLFLLDTGVRASELCSLHRKDLDLQGRRATVLGKGNKHRSVYFGGSTARALWNYLKIDRDEPREEDAPLFLADRGTRAGEALTRSGVLQLIERLGRAAKVEAVRCSPHTFRHTFAVEFLRAGGNVFTLQQLLGHTGIQMTQRYVALAQADIENQHRQFSPVDRLKGRGR